MTRIPRFYHGCYIVCGPDEAVQHPVASSEIGEKTKRTRVGQGIRQSRLVALVLCLFALLSISMPRAPVVAESSGPVTPIVQEGGDVRSASYTGCAGPIVSASNTLYEQQAIDRANAERADQGLPPLKLVRALSDAARYHANDMAQDGYFEHDTHDRVGRQLEWVCSVWSRIGSYYPSPGAENIAAGYATPQSMMSGWMDSGGHRDNILSMDYREVGVGYAQGGSWSHYWVMNFGQRDDVYPLIINRESAITDSVYVSLYLYGDWQEVRLRNDGDAWSNWQPFSNTLNWTLPTRAGEHTVWAEMRTGGQTAQSSDTILLDAPPTLGGLSGEIRFLYSIPEGRLLPDGAQVTPLNMGTDVLFTWQAKIAGPWFEDTLLTGRAGDSFHIVPTGLDLSTAGMYTGTVTVAVTDLDDVQGSPQQTDLIVQVIDTPFKVLYLPMLIGR